MIHLWETDPPGYDPCLSPEIPGITPYLLEGPGIRPAIVVCPGGAYTHRAEHEGEPVARWLNGLGLHAFVLNYRVAPYRLPWPMVDAQRALRLIRHRAAEWRVDPKHLAIIGFSAGGHLAAAAGTLFGTEWAPACDAVDREPDRPDALILCYPFITAGKHRHDHSMHSSLVGDKPTPQLLALLSLERGVSDRTPPVFLWHTADDKRVPVENSLLFADALRKHGIPFELHVFAHGRHGLGIKNDVPAVQAWMGLCATWLRGINFQNEVLKNQSLPR